MKSHRHVGHGWVNTRGSSHVLTPCFADLLDSVFSILSLLFSYFDFPESLDVDVDVESDRSIEFLVVPVNGSPLERVIDQEVFAILFGSQIDSADEGLVELDVEDVDLDDILVDLPVVLQKTTLELLLSQLLRLHQTHGEKRQIGVILLIVEEQNGSGLAPIN